MHIFGGVSAMKEFTLMFSGKRDAVIYLLVEADGGSFNCNNRYRCEDAFAMSAKTVDMKSGIYRIWLPADGGAPRELVMQCSECVTPFIIPGPGITPSHFPEPHPSLSLAGNRHYELYIPMATGQHSAYIAYKRSDASEPEIRIYDDKGVITPEWMPICQGMPYRCTMIKTDSQTLRLNAFALNPLRLTAWEGNAILLGKPDGGLPTGSLCMRAYDRAGERLDARFEVYVGNELIMERDVLCDEDGYAELPEGKYTVYVHHGGRYNRVSINVILLRDSVRNIDVCLNELVTLPRGWAWGDEHVHSVYEDGAPLPDMIMRAARAAGSNFVFLTDHDVDGLLRYGVSSADKAGVFVGMPGQEITCHELHMNVLNARWQIPVELEPYTLVHTDICSRIESYLNEISRMNADGQTAFMLNHPSHMQSVQDNPALGYFRSWWVQDKFPQFKIVENYDFQGWFDRLNRGEHLTGVWTTDSHDCSRLYAGKKGTCVYVGDELTPKNIIDGLMAGHCFNARWPGAAIFLSVNETNMGDTLSIKRGTELIAHISAKSAVSIERMDVVVNGFVAAEISAHDAMSIEADVKLPADAAWTIARIYMKDSQWPMDGHSHEPLMESGVGAFTNPVYIREV